MSVIDETSFTDRELLLHAAKHMEELTRQVSEMHEVFERFRPLIDHYAPGGPVDALAAMQAGREMRRARKAGRHGR
jgi:hypothetical protein